MTPELCAEIQAMIVGSPRVGSNPKGVELEQLCFSFTQPGNYAGMTRAKVTLEGLEPAIFGSEDHYLIQ